MSRDNRGKHVKKTQQCEIIRQNLIPFARVCSGRKCPPIERPKERHRNISKNFLGGYCHDACSNLSADLQFNHSISGLVQIGFELPLQMTPC